MHGLRRPLHPYSPPHSPLQCLASLPSAPQPWLPAGRGQWEGEAPTARGPGLPPAPAQVPWSAALSSIGPLPWLCGGEVPISPTRLSKRNFRLGPEVCFFFLQSIFLQFNLKIGTAGCTCIKRIHFITVYEWCHNKIGVFNWGIFPYSTISWKTRRVAPTWLYSRSWHQLAQTGPVSLLPS